MVIMIMMLIIIIMVLVIITEPCKGPGGDASPAGLSH